MEVTERAQWKLLKVEKGDKVLEFTCGCLYLSHDILIYEGRPRTCPEHKTPLLRTFLSCLDCGKVFEINCKANSQKRDRECAAIYFKKYQKEYNRTY